MREVRETALGLKGTGVRRLNDFLLACCVGTRKIYVVVRRPEKEKMVDSVY